MRIALIAGAALLANGAVAFAQTSMDHSSMQGTSAVEHGRQLSQPGQSAFGAIQETVERLEADPNTDWAHVNLDALREHLIDMDEVTMRAEIRSEPIAGGSRFYVTGEGRTRDAIQRMITGHALSMGDAAHWTMAAESTPQGAIVTALAKQPSDLPRVRSLGLLGMMAEGAHHQAHHWFLSTGESPMAHN